MSCWIRWRIASRFPRSSSVACSRMRPSMSGYVPYVKRPPPATNASSLVAVVPRAALVLWITCSNRFSPYSLKKAARSSGRSVARIPIAPQYPATASANDAFARSTEIVPASKPFGYPASARSCFAPLGVVRVQRGWPVALETLGDHAGGEFREPERLGLIDGRAVDRQVGGEAHAPIGPRRSWIPLLGEDVP